MSHLGDKLWADPAAAREKIETVKILKQPLEDYQEAAKLYEDTGVLIQLSNDENDSSFTAEINNNINELEVTLKAQQVRLTLNGEYDKNNAIISLTAGAGGTDAQDWTEMLLRMYTRWAEKQNYIIEVVDISAGEEAGLKNATLIVKGPYAYGYLKGEKGIHRLVRLSPFNANNKRQTSFAALDVMPEIAEKKHEDINPEDLKIDTYRASGAGGQHINKTDSAVRITHLPTGIVVQCQNNRSQTMNKEIAMRLLYSKIVQLMEEQHEKEIAKLRGAHKDIAWGSQIRSYVFHPYSMVKDHRTQAETSQVSKVMDGELNYFIESYLRNNAK
jgi:peptide chain release factor 2